MTPKGSCPMGQSLGVSHGTPPKSRGNGTAGTRGTPGTAGTGRGPNRFRQRDVTRAVRAAASAGLKVAAVKIDPATGVIEVVTGDSPVQDSKPLDAWMAKHARPTQGH